MALEDSGISDKTRDRYAAGVTKILPYLETSPLGLEDAVCKWIEDNYWKGQCITYISDTLSGLQHFLPWCKGNLTKAWKLFRIWRKIERPKQAPPLPISFVLGLLGRCIEENKLELAVLIAVGFWGLLRTGELLQLQANHVLIGTREMILQLGYTKTGLRRAVDENVVVHHPLAILFTTALLQEKGTQERLWSGTPQLFRDEFHRLISFFRLSESFRPYSLRRGGATAEFKAHGQMEKTLLKGRWGTSLAARQYIQEGLSELTRIRIPPATANLLKHYSSLCLI